MFSSLFSNKKTEPDLSFISVDMHSHLLPGLDDGLKSVDESVQYIKELSLLGYKKLICTPHIISDIYPNTNENILWALSLVRQALKDNNIDFMIEAAAEYMVDMGMENYVKSGKPLLTFGRKYILIEMSYIGPSPNIEQVIFQLCLKGLRPVLAHPERYNYYHNNFKMYQRFIDMGCVLQVNLLSLLGYYGKPSKQIAEKLIKSGMVTLLGTDMHHENHLNSLKKLASKKQFYSLVSGREFQNKYLL